MRWTSLGGFGDRFVEKARCSPLVGSRGDSRSFVQMAHTVHALMSDAPMSIDHGGAMLDTSHGTGHEMRRAGGNHVARLTLPVLWWAEWYFYFG